MSMPIDDTSRVTTPSYVTEGEAVTDKKLERVENLIQKVNEQAFAFGQRLPFMINIPDLGEKITELTNFVTLLNTAAPEKLAAIPSFLQKIQQFEKLAEQSATECQAAIDKYGVADYGVLPLRKELEPGGILTRMLGLAVELSGQIGSV
jgi:hypothetical protein